jgi:hypothetical protein
VDLISVVSRAIHKDRVKTHMKITIIDRAVEFWIQPTTTEMNQTWMRVQVLSHVGQQRLNPCFRSVFQSEINDMSQLFHGHPNLPFL